MRTYVIIITMLLLLLFCGCWDNREVEELLLTDALIFDINKTKEYNLGFISTKQTASEQTMGIGEEGTQAKSQQWMADSNGKTFEESLTKFSMRSPRYIYLTDTKILIIGENLAREGVSNILDFVIRKKQLRLRNYIVLAQGNPYEKLSVKPEFENTITGELIQILERGSKEGDFFFFNDLKSFAKDIITPGRDGYLPIIDTIKADENKKNKPEPALIVSRVALFHNDKMAGILNLKETQGFNILSNYSKKGNISVKIDGEYFSFTYDEIKVNRKLVKESPDNISINYIIQLKGNIKEAHHKMDLSNRGIKNLETMISKETEKILKNTIQSCKDIGSDALGIGRFIHIKSPETWKEYSKNWDETYREINIKANVNVEIKGTNFATKTIIN